MHVVRVALVLAVCMVLQVGCNPGVTVRKNPTDCDTGIRYYRPKPYLVLRPTGTSTATSEGKTTKTTREPSDEFVEIGLEYLPDFAEEYALQVTPGFGKANVDITLTQGWNLTSVDQELDSKFSENVGALVEAAKVASSIKSADANVRSPQPVESYKKWVVRATNVPLGYYEAVINADATGRKRLWGWRYVGFAPFNSCPTDIAGAQGSCCDDPTMGTVYGLAFQEGVMVFKQLNVLRDASNTERINVDTGLMKYTSAPKASVEKKALPPSKDDAFKQIVAAAFASESKKAIPIENIVLELMENNDLLVKIKLPSDDYDDVTSKPKNERKLKEKLHSAISEDALQTYESAMLAFEFVEASDD